MESLKEIIQAVSSSTLYPGWVFSPLLSIMQVMHAWSDMWRLIIKFLLVNLFILFWYI